MVPTHKPSLFSQVAEYGTYAELRQRLPSEIRAILPAIDQTLDEKGTVVHMFKRSNAPSATEREIR